ncbi:GPP34 family phosphoprotein [Streptomyces achromogenes]|uniref:GPP34 family phosphoprotein n=1 Tax=Streptomyces achromogenes TaxID=67255 RepID=A0ABZ1KLU1_STRAH
MKTTLGEEIMLLTLDDETGVVQERTRADHAVAAATLAELALAGRIGIVEGDVAVQDRSPMGVPALDTALETIAAREKPAEPYAWVSRLARTAVADARRGLLDKGLVREERKKRWGVFSVTRYPEADGAPEAALRAGLSRVVLDGADPDERQSALLAVVHGAGLHESAFPGADQRAVARRLARLSQGSWAAVAVRKALENLQIEFIAST